jgi:hypothetical protein
MTMPRRSTAEKVVAVEGARIIQALVAYVGRDVAEDHSLVPQDKAAGVDAIDRVEAPVDVVIGHPDTGILPAPPD